MKTEKRTYYRFLNIGTLMSGTMEITVNPKARVMTGKHLGMNVSVSTRCREEDKFSIRAGEAVLFKKMSEILLNAEIGFMMEKVQTLKGIKKFHKNRMNEILETNSKKK